MAPCVAKFLAYVGTLDWSGSAPDLYATLYGERVRIVALRHNSFGVTPSLGSDEPLFFIDPSQLDKFGDAP